ncbi:hypothetical protein XA68_12022 [Ophiocordyceps unilateralis]|uniref:Uncharacterized protein n=1 Tax=Ophiocordyceps unilateralis TaxID=268505 RepID=A0A2A9PE80_OPHUN|nr:hypothetical protein XA68_12022 [Ophiocordyceps unilateralis]
MKVPSLSLLSLALILSPGAARWVFDKRTSCQVCQVGKLGAADVCCSASVPSSPFLSLSFLADELRPQCAGQHKDIHGGHCDKNKYARPYSGQASEWLRN